MRVKREGERDKEKEEDEEEISRQEINKAIKKLKEKSYKKR